MDMPVVGDTVRSFDFPMPFLRKVTNCFIEGTVERILIPPDSPLPFPVYEIRVTKDVIEGVSVPHRVGKMLYPPLNGMPSVAGGLTDGVEVIAHTLTPEEAAQVTITVLYPTAKPPEDFGPLWLWDAGDSYIVANAGAVCPIWGDKIPYKAVTAVVPPQFEESAKYSLEYVHGGGSVTKRNVLGDGRVALRSEYQAW